MRKNRKAEAAGAAGGPEKVAAYEVGDDEAGMRLDRWLHRRFPDISNSHLMKIVRKGEVRVSGRRTDVSTRLEAGQTVRVIKVESTRLVVRAVDEEIPSPAAENPLERPIDTIADDPFGEPLV